jgi:hypothetical protein
VSARLVRLVLVVALTWLRPVRAARTIREQREAIRVLVNVTADLATARRGGERHLYLIK